jgi:hypothetical protein
MTSNRFVLPQDNHLLYNISYLWTYDLYGPVLTAFDAGNSITRASGRWLGMKIETFWGPVKCHRAVRRVPTVSVLNLAG